MNLIVKNTLMFFLLLALLSFKDKDFKMPVPPGTIKIDENFYVDEAEVTNFSYLEYLYWLKNVYGIHSKEYQSALPDTTVWSESLVNKKDYETNYLRHPLYKDYPVVGISRSQAENFCQWRSDRVFQHMLIKKKKIKFFGYAKGDSIFTIEKYFSGKYLHIKPDTSIEFYPEYTLPDSLDYIKIYQYTDSLIHRYQIKFSKYKNFSPTCCLLSAHTSNDVLFPAISGSFGKYLPLSYVSGNVREWVKGKDLAFGGSYIDSCSNIKKHLFQYQDKNTAYTGFRCVCRYRKFLNH